MPGEPLEVWPLMQQSLGFVLISAITVLATLDASHPVIAKAPLLPVLLYGFIFVHLTISVQVAHATKQKYLPWKAIVMIDAVALLANWICWHFFEAAVREDYFFGLLLFLHSFLQGHFILGVIHEFT